MPSVAVTVAAPNDRTMGTVTELLPDTFIILTGAAVYPMTCLSRQGGEQGVTDVGRQSESEFTAWPSAPIGAERSFVAGHRTC